MINISWDLMQAPQLDYIHVVTITGIAYILQIFEMTFWCKDTKSNKFEMTESSNGRVAWISVHEDHFLLIESLDILRKCTEHRPFSYFVHSD